MGAVVNLHEQLEALANLPCGWNNDAPRNPAPPPSTLALTALRRILDAVNTDPTGLFPDAMDGAAAEFDHGELTLTVWNSGRVSIAGVFNHSAWFDAEDFDAIVSELRLRISTFDHNDAVAAWHESDSSLSLMEWLGMSIDRYGVWLNSGK